MKKKFFEYLDAIDAIIDGGPDYIGKMDSIRAEAITSKTVSMRLDDYFFNLIEGPQWFEPLYKHNYFSHPPVEDTAWWPQSNWLARHASSSKKITAQILNSIPETNNHRIHWELCQAASQVEIEDASKWALTEIQWIDKQDSLEMNLPNHIGELIICLSDGGKKEVALDLAKSLFRISEDPEAKEKRSKAEQNIDDEFSLPYRGTPHLKVEKYWYEEILEKTIRSLAPTNNMDVIKWLCELLSDAITYSGDREDGSDGSYYWRQAIEDHPQNNGYDIQDSILVALRDTAQEMIKLDGDNFFKIVDHLENGIHEPTPVFARLIMYLLKVYPEISSAYLTKYLNGKEYFARVDYMYEYSELTRACFSLLDEKDKKMIYSWLREKLVKDRQSYIARGIEGVAEDELELERYDQIWAVQFLEPYVGNLEPSLANMYDKALEIQGPMKGYRMAFQSVSSEGFKSPKSSNNIAEMQFADLINYLQSWIPKEGFGTPSRTGLSTTLEELVSNHPEDYYLPAALYGDIHPTYINGWITGYKLAQTHQHPFDWEKVLNLCEWILEQEFVFPQKYAVREGHEPNNWSRSLSGIADMLQNGFGLKNECQIPFEHDNRVFDILLKLLDHQELKQDDLKHEEGDTDPVDLSLNSTRGRAMHALMQYVFWHQRQHKENNGPDAPLLTFSDLPQVKEVLEEKLDLEVEPSHTIRSAYGKWLPWLIVWDESWVITNLEKILPTKPEEQIYWDTAWRTYVTLNRPYDNVFSVLKKEYERAVDNLGSFKQVRERTKTPDQSLVHHLMAYYWRGYLDLEEGSLVERFFNLAPEELRGYAIEQLGLPLRENGAQVPPEILERIKLLWTSRLKLVEKSPSAANEQEIALIGQWVSTGALDPVWGLAQLMAVLNLGIKVKISRKLSEKLAEWSTQYPLETVSCFRMIAESTRDYWALHGWEESGMVLLDNAINSGVKEARDHAIELTHRMGELGFLKYRDVLPG